MKTWKVTLIGAALVAANAAIANVTVTGERIGVTPFPSLNLSHDLRKAANQIAYASERPSPLNFPNPRYQRTGEIQLPGAFNPNDPRDRNGNRISPELQFPCSPLFFRQCGDPEITAWSGAGVSALRFYLGPKVDVATFERTRQRMNRILETDYGMDTSDSGHPENQRVDGMALPSIDTFESFPARAQ